MSDEPSARTDAGQTLELVENQLARHIRAFSSAKRFFRRMSLIQTVSTATLAATTTLLIGLAQVYEHAWLNALSLASSSLATVSAAWTGWYGAREGWVTNQRALNRLYELRSRIAFESTLRDRASETDRAAQYYAEYQRILNDANSQWEQNRLSQTQ
ncbi:SLATT domain-containing protein [Streptomyces sp. NPDC091280]|uniref:SLATT domain-containing protein n=1 Tax=Streptomyces sp. NPDC091280 TaxID=3365984 RepID=UPI00381392E0